MRTEREVIDQLLEFARINEMVRAVWMNGSRVNPSVKKDPFCDYDVVFAVTSPNHFVQDQSWISNFGELIILQQNDCSEGDLEAYIFLMLFSDGVRIDLAFDRIDQADRYLDDSLTVVLLDKDHRLPALPLPSEAIYLTEKPSRMVFDETTNEFWWCSTNVAKGIWRDELSYAKFMYEVIVQDQLIKMVSWYIACRKDWNVNSGYHGKWIKKFLEPELYDSLQKTYAGGDYEAMWEALFEAGRLFRTIGMEVAGALGYTYPLQDDQRVSEYLRRVRSLPADAVDFH